MEFSLVIEDFLSANQKNKLPISGWISVIIAGLLLIGVITQFSFGEGLPLYFSQKGPGTQHAFWALSLAGGLIIGVLMQKSRFCSNWRIP